MPNIFDSSAKVLVNPVNCVGVMGAGLAKQFRDKYPDMFKDYVLRCRRGFQPGQLHCWRTPSGQIIANFPTKYHWRDPSRVQYIEDGLEALNSLVLNNRLGSIAMPKIGCGLGGLSWSTVKPIIRRYLGCDGRISVEFV